MKLILDTAIVGRLCHPRKHRDVRAWFLRVVREHDPLLSEVADYELRRELVRIGAVHGLSRLDELAREIRYLPVTTDTWRAAAHLWAFMRRTGRATAAGSALDADMLIAAQARAEGAVVVTPNTKHFEVLTAALDAADVPLSSG